MQHSEKILQLLDRVHYNFEADCSASLLDCDVNEIKAIIKRSLTKYPYPLCDLTIQDWINLRNKRKLL